ncbi:hypothetical protein BJ508DRAFT_417486 [Ascobolus immersus RN42]|uniref:Uncharacterized protein n=1 Tax=Ascobolus immersus RN42 TaxID=1160509 RepID=A0A3N4HUI0_ASCIM|nr:hypothetical protein BJ508DRAFT_417486 [Ascobolus immersus RN42]
MKFTTLLLTALLAPLAAARCTRRDNVSFAPSPWNATTPQFTAPGWSLSLGPKDIKNPSLPRDAILTTGNPVLPPPFFADRGLWLYQTGSTTKKLRAYMYRTDATQADKGWTWKWASEAEIAKLDQGRVQKEFWDIGCVYEGRHFLSIGNPGGPGIGGYKWQVCRPWGKGEWKLMMDVTREGMECVDSVNFWVDYVTTA